MACQISVRLCKGYSGTREHGGKMDGNTGTFRKKVREHGNIALPISGTGNIIFEGKKIRKAQQFRKLWSLTLKCGLEVNLEL